MLPWRLEHHEIQLVMERKYLLDCVFWLSWIDLQIWKTTQVEIIGTKQEAETSDVIQIWWVEACRVDNTSHQLIIDRRKLCLKYKRHIKFILLTRIISMFRTQFQMYRMEWFKQSHRNAHLID